jgi:hypothetical protein
MSDRVKAALEMIQGQIKELDGLAERAAQDTNAVAAGERLGKWKERTTRLIAAHLGANEAKRFSEKKLAREFFYGDLADEVAEETDLYRGCLVSLTSQIKTRGDAIFEQQA